MTDDCELKLRIILESPPLGIDYGLQKGNGHDYETIQKQKSDGRNLKFEFSVRVEVVKAGAPNFLGEYTQGTRDARFIYLDIGACAGQIDTIWSRRLKIPLKGITPEMIAGAIDNPNIVLETHVPGTGRDGGPNCATVKPFEGWKIAFKN